MTENGEKSKVLKVNLDEQASATVDNPNNIDILVQGNLNTTKPKKVRLIYCSDGVIEECDEDEEERARLEKEEKEKKIQEQIRLDAEAKNMPWMPWMGYMMTKTASKSLEVFDSAGEKLAWWFGITKPKFLYEIEEYNRMKREQEERALNEDAVEEIHIGENGLLNRSQLLELSNVTVKPSDVSMMKKNLFQSDS